MAKEKHLSVHYSGADDATVWADPNQFRFIVRNLVYNAIKYSHAGETVEINASSQGAACMLSVTDTGEGISQETIEALYGNAPIETQLGTAGEEGAGLGLRICLEFAQLNRGHITIKNNSANKGTSFFLELPRQPEAI
jgi:signal transduction histidine kinase